MDFYYFTPHFTVHLQFVTSGSQRCGDEVGCAVVQYGHSGGLDGAGRHSVSHIHYKCYSDLQKLHRKP